LNGVLEKWSRKKECAVQLINVSTFQDDIGTKTSCLLYIFAILYKIKQIQLKTVLVIPFFKGHELFAAGGNQAMAYQVYLCRDPVRVLSLRCLRRVGRETWFNRTTVTFGRTRPFAMPNMVDVVSVEHSVRKVYNVLYH
jgi:hypothetical protein